MDKEFKIVISVFSFFLIYGLTSLFNSGSFETPVFFNQLIFFLVAVIFWLMNKSETGSWILAVFIPVQFLYCLIDPFIMGYLYEVQNVELAKSIYNSTALNFLFLVSYFGFMVLVSFWTYKKHRRAYVLVAKLLLIFATIFLLYYPGLEFDPSYPFFAFLLLFVFTVNRLTLSATRGLSILSHQFLLIFLLEALEYLH